MNGNLGVLEVEEECALQDSGIEEVTVVSEVSPGVDNAPWLPERHRVNLSLNNEDLRRYGMLGSKLAEHHKMEGDPSKTQFWYDCVDLLFNLYEYVERRKHELDCQQKQLDEEYKRWRFKK